MCMCRESDGWFLAWGGIEHLLLGNLAFSTQCYHWLFSAEGGGKNISFCQDKTFSSTQNALGPCRTFFSKQILFNEFPLKQTKPNHKKKKPKPNQNQQIFKGFFSSSPLISNKVSYLTALHINRVK